MYNPKPSAAFRYQISQTVCRASTPKGGWQEGSMKLAMAVLAAALGAGAQETLTIQKLAIPFSPGERALCVTLTEDGALLAYHSRGREAGREDADIWLTRRGKAGRWSTPYNAGPAINTSANEVDA